MDTAKIKNEFVELIKLAPSYGKVPRLLSYILALTTIIVSILFPIIADLVKNGHIFSSIYTALVVGYVCVFMKIGYYYFLNTKTYVALIRPTIFMGAWFDLIRENKIYWFKALDAFFTFLPITVIIIFYILTPFLYILIYNNG